MIAVFLYILIAMEKNYDILAVIVNKGLNTGQFSKNLFHEL